MDDTRILLEEQNEKNDLLERKFRKVDSELIEVKSLFSWGKFNLYTWAHVPCVHNAYGMN